MDRLPTAGGGLQPGRRHGGSTGVARAPAYEAGKPTATARLAGWRGLGWRGLVPFVRCERKNTKLRGAQEKVTPFRGVPKEGGVFHEQLSQVDGGSPGTHCGA